MKYIKTREKRLKIFSEHLKNGKLLGQEKYAVFFRTVIQSSKTEEKDDDDDGVPIYLMPIFELPYLFDS